MRLTYRSSLSSLVTVFLLSLFVLVGCGGSDTAAPTATTSANLSTTNVSASNPTATLPPIATAPVGTPTSGGVDCIRLGIAPLVPAPSGMVTVGIVQHLSHPALDRTAKGVIDALTCAGYVEGVTIHIDRENANGKTDQLQSIVQKFKDDGAKVVVTVGTPSMTNAYKVLQNTDVQIVFNAVTDPYKAGVATSPSGHSNITGVQALPPVADLWKYMLQTLPNAKKVGIIWNASEPNSAVATGLAQQQAVATNITLVQQNVTKPDGVQAAAQALIDQGVDAFFISTDNTVANGLESLLNLATTSKKPVFINDPDGARRGACLAYGLDYTDNGAQSAQMVIQILQGKLAKDIPITMEKKGQLVINTLGAQQEGVTIPSEITSKADQTLDKIETPKK